MSDNGNLFVEVDSLVANEFAVEVDGSRLTGVFRVGGLTTFKLNADQKVQTIPFTLSKMVQRDGNNAFNKWLRETIAAKHSIERPTRTVAVIAIDDGVETRRWTFTGAFITEVNYSDFDSGSSEMVQESVTVHYAEVNESWSATANLE